MNLGRGSIGGQKLKASPREIAAMRVAAARKNPHWTEIEDDLVARKPRYLVSASTDQTYRRFTGATFVGGRLEFAADRPLAFYVAAGDVVVLEPLGKTWSEMFDEQLQPPPKPKRRRRVRA